MGESNQQNIHIPAGSGHPLAEAGLVLTSGSRHGATAGSVRVTIGQVRFNGWEIHSVEPVTAELAGRRAILAKVHFDIGITSDAPALPYVEVGFEFSDDVQVADGLPGQVVKPQPARNYTVTPYLAFAPAESGSAVSVPALRPAIDIFGIGGATMRWRFSATPDCELRSGSRTGWLLLLAPSDRADLKVRALTAFDLGLAEALGLQPAPGEDTFTVRLPDDGRSLAPGVGVRASSRVSGVVIALGFVVDIAGFSQRTEPGQKALQDRLVAVVLGAVEDAGVAREAARLQTTGDGVNVFLPPDVDLSTVLGRLMLAMANRLGLDNQRHADRMRLRMATDIGPVGNSLLGFSGDTVISFGRLVDSDPIREAMKSNPDADVAVLVSGTLNTMILRHGYPELAGLAFREVLAVVKGYQAQAWLWVGPRSPARDDQ